MQSGSELTQIRMAGVTASGCQRIQNADHRALASPKPSVLRTERVSCARARAI